MTYLEKLQAEYRKLHAEIRALTDGAATANRDLTPEELTSVTEKHTRCAALYAQIEPMQQHESRAAAVGGVAAAINQNADGSPTTPAGTNPATDNAPALDGTQTRAVGIPDGGPDAPPATTTPRDPGHYRKAGTAGVARRSFFGDMYRAAPQTYGDTDAAQRLADHANHMRALTSTAAGAGLVAPKWLTDEYDKLARQGRVVANAVRQIALDGPAPLTLPKQTAGTDAVVAQQAAENDPVSGTDAYASSVDVVTPRAIAGKQVVSRQMLDSGNPAADELIYLDLFDVLNVKIEGMVGAALLAASGAPVVTLANEAAFKATGAAWDAAVDTAIDVWDKRKLPADFYTSGIRRWGEFKKLKDADGHPLIPARSGGMVNIIGQGDVRSAGELDVLPYLPTDAISATGTYPQKVLAVRAADAILFEDAVRRFKFEEQAGPESIVIGIWEYAATIVRQVGKSVRCFQVTAA